MAEREILKVMKLTKRNITNLKKATSSGLEKDVLEYILNRWDEYDDKTDIFRDVLKYGCQSGCVDYLIYYSDTIAYYEKYKDEICGLLYDTLVNCGLKCPFDLFGDKWDNSDTLALEAENKNLLAWFGFEETMRNIAYNFEELEDII